MTRRPTHITCGICSTQVEIPANFCDMCGAPLSPRESSREASPVIADSQTDMDMAEEYASLPEWARVCIVAGIGLLPETLILTTGFLRVDLIGLNILYLPLLLGLTVSVAKPASAVSWVDRLNNWLIRKKGQVAERSGYISRFFLKPLLWGLTKIMMWTEHIDNQFLRCGVRITSYLYFIVVMVLVALLMVYVVLIITAFVVGIILGILLLLFILWFIGVLLDGPGSGGRGYKYVRAIKNETRTWRGNMDKVQHHTETSGIWPFLRTTKHIYEDTDGHRGEGWTRDAAQGALKKAQRHDVEHVIDRGLTEKWGGKVNRDKDE